MTRAGAILDTDARTRRVAELAETYGFAVDPSAVVEDLSVGEEQRVEILKALYRGVDLLILDEPTAVLTPPEAKELFENLRRLRDDGKAIVFISHKLDEVLEIADRITVLRRGGSSARRRRRRPPRRKLAEMMVGRPVLFRLEKPEVEPGEPVLEVDGSAAEGKLNGISLEVRAGEILGVAGVEGNGQRELAEALIGLRPPAAGTITLAGHDIAGGRWRRSGTPGSAYIPEDRHEQGLVLDMTLWENAVLGREDDTSFSGRGGFLFIQKIKGMAQRLVKLFDVRARTINVTRGTLSGGNQQKLILARELDTGPKLLIASQPTRGLDVGAIEFVWRQILNQKEAGRGVLLISAELDEIYALSDRIVTIYEGRITGEYRARRGAGGDRRRHARTHRREGGELMAAGAASIPAPALARPVVEAAIVQGVALLVALRRRPARRAR